MTRLAKTSRSKVFLALAGGVLAGGLMLASAPALADDDDDDRRRHRHHHQHHHHSHGQGHGGKQVFYDGNCRIERKWNGHGGYKEEVRCRPHARAYYPAPVVAYYPPPPPVYVGPPTISVVIPIGR